VLVIALKMVEFRKLMQFSKVVSDKGGLLLETFPAEKVKLIGLTLMFE
jgi:hypothetical protein